jgi:hypothetical protein
MLAQAMLIDSARTPPALNTIASAIQLHHFAIIAPVLIDNAPIA